MVFISLLAVICIFFFSPHKRALSRSNGKRTHFARHCNELFMNVFLLVNILNISPIVVIYAHFYSPLANLCWRWWACELNGLLSISLFFGICLHLPHRDYRSATKIAPLKVSRLERKKSHLRWILNFSYSAFSFNENYVNFVRMSTARTLLPRWILNICIIARFLILSHRSFHFLLKIDCSTNGPKLSTGGSQKSAQSMERVWVA